MLALDGQRRSPGKGGGQRLRAAHATQAGSQHPAPRQVAAEMLATGFHKGLVSALHDALRADVNPAARRHLAVHHQPRAIEFVEVLPSRPLRHQVGVGNQHAGCIGVGAEHAHRFAALHQQGFIGLQCAQAVGDSVKTGPVACRFADAAIDHQRVRILGHLGVQVVMQHAVGGFDLPVGAVQC